MVFLVMLQSRIVLFHKLCQSKFGLLQRYYLLHLAIQFFWNFQFPGQCSSSNLGFQNITMRYPYPIHIHDPFFVTIQLNTLNFLIWESQIVNLIESQGCLGFIDGSIAPQLQLLLYLYLTHLINLCQILSITNGGLISLSRAG